MTNPSLCRLALLIVSCAVSLSAGRTTPASAAEGELRWGLHVTLAAKWLGPAETEAFIRPFMVLYAVHDALVKPMPSGLSHDGYWRKAPSANLIPGFAYSAPMEDLKLKAR